MVSTVRYDVDETDETPAGVAGSHPAKTVRTDSIPPAELGVSAMGIDELNHLRVGQRAPPAIRDAVGDELLSNSGRGQEKSDYRAPSLPSDDIPEHRRRPRTLCPNEGFRHYEPMPEQHLGGDPAQGLGLSISSNELYGEIWAEDPSALKVELGRSLAPRATTMLYDEFARLGVDPDDLVLDAGGRDAVHAIEIVRRLECCAITIDPVPLHVDRARERVAAAGLEDRIDVVQAATESLPFEDASIDFVWCRDVLNHVQLDPSLREFARVLRSGGSVLVYQTFAETACEPEEARRLFAASASVAENMSAPFFETRAGEAGFEVVSTEQLRGEWRERMIEDGTWDVAADLLALSRLHRRERDAVEQYGRARVEAARGGILWGVYQLLGKLCPTIYVLRRPA